MAQRGLPPLIGAPWEREETSGFSFKDAKATGKAILADIEEIQGLLLERVGGKLASLRDIGYLSKDDIRTLGDTSHAAFQALENYRAALRDVLEAEERRESEARTPLQLRQWMFRPGQRRSR